MIDTMANQILSDLNPVQQQAVRQTDGPVLILAGAGSGKTRVLSYRTVYLMTQKKVPGNNILMVTFTNKAAGEMKERVKKLLTSLHNEESEASKYTLPFMGTFHSFCSRLLRIEGRHIGLSPNYLIYDSDDQKTLIRNILKDMDIDVKKVNPSAIHGIISQSKNENISAREYSQVAKGPYQQVVAQVFETYEKRLKEIDALDFDDLLTKSIELFRGVPQVLDKYQELFKYIMVDEYQDTNHVQYTITRLLARKYNNICVVGDMSQSIYKFRGADIRNILAFEKDYPSAKVFALEENYRSTQYILDTATAVISKNTGHKVLKLFTKNPSGLPITIYEAQNEIDEAYYVIKQVVNNEFLYKDVAVLYRTNAQSRSLEEAFIKNSIPYKLIGGLRFYDRKEIRDLLAYLRYLRNPKDNVSLERITKIGKTKLKKFQEFQKQYQETVFALDEIEKKHPKAQTKQTEPQTMEFSFFDDQPVLEVSPNEPIAESSSFSLPTEELTHTTFQLLEKIIDITDYIEYIDDGTDMGTQRVENIKELKTVAAQYPHIDQFLENVSLLEGPETVSGRHRAESEYNAVTLMTLHAAKGLEFKHVFIVGWEEGLFPHSRALLDNNELEEERRLAYVGITRAMQDLYLTYTINRTIYGSHQASVVSRFIADIPESLIKFENAYSQTGRRSGAIGGGNYKNKIQYYSDQLDNMQDDISW
jgi:DNA helicase-2/ATP-dependent DNA helicase PcrA